MALNPLNSSNLKQLASKGLNDVSLGSRTLCVGVIFRQQNSDAIK